MNSIFYTYNNEAIAICVLYSVLCECKRIDIARIALVLPLLLNNSFVSVISKRDNCSFEELLQTTPDVVSNFNSMYQSLLPTFVNSITFLEKCGQFDVSDHISITDNTKRLISECQSNRLKSILKVIDIFLKCIEKYETKQLYQILRVQL